jgi:hypothetical protein
MRKIDTSAKFSQDLFERMCAIVSTGVTVTQACKDAGIAHSSLWRWLQPGSAQYEQVKLRWAEALELQAHAGFDDLDECAKPVPGEDAVAVNGVSQKCINDMLKKASHMLRLTQK